MPEPTPVTEKRTLDVIDSGDDVYLITEPDGGPVRGVFFPDGKPGWWRGSWEGQLRRLFVERDVADPVRQIVDRLLAG